MMRSPSEPALTARVFALCLLLSAALQIIENLLPRIPLFPWLKLGLSHLVLLPFLLRYGVRAALLLLLGRNLLALLFAGGAFTTFLVGGASGAAALLLGGGLARAAVRAGWLGLAGAGMLLAALMNLAQLAVAEILIVHHRAFFFQLAPLLAWSALSGAAVAWLAHRALPVLEEVFSDASAAAPAPPGKAEGFPWALVAWLGAAGLLFLPRSVAGLPYQAAALAALLAVSPLAGGRRGLRADLLALARGWPWFLYLASLHLFAGDGMLLWGSWVTRPGAEACLFYSARLAGLILIGPHLARAFPAGALGRSASVYGRGLALCLPLLPGLHGAAMRCRRDFLRALRGRGEAGVLRGLAQGFREALDGAR